MYSLAQRGLAEAFGTAALVLVGPGSVVATLVLAGKSTPAVTEADLLGISFSGCHINPAVTFALAVTRRVPWRELPVYWVAQVIGGIVGALAIWAAFGHQAVTLGMGQTAFADSTSYWAAAFSELVGTGLLIFTILGIVDSRSPSDLAGLVIGGVVVGIILIFGPVTGASLNPARALGPELVSTIAGGPTHWAQYVPVYLVPGLVGAALAAFAYDFMAKPRLVQEPIEHAVSQPDVNAAS